MPFPGRRRGRGRWVPRRTCLPCPCWFPLFAPVGAKNGSRLRESHLPGRTIVQPVQLSLLPQEVPAPLPELASRLPGEEVTKAVAQLAGLIARMQAARGAGDER